jgi:hypothetical protein
MFEIEDDYLYIGSPVPNEFNNISKITLYDDPPVVTMNGTYRLLRMDFIICCEEKKNV